MTLEQGNIEAAIRRGFIEFDNEMASDDDMKEDLAGTTAICVLIKDQKLYCVCQIKRFFFFSIIKIFSHIGKCR